MDDVEDRGDRAREALEGACVGLLSDLRQHSRGRVVSLGVVGAVERMAAVLRALRGPVGHGAPPCGPAERLVSARAAVAVLVEDAEALGLSAQLLLLLARAAHALSDAERVLLPGSWESS